MSPFLLSVLVAAPKYLEARGEPLEPQELIGKKHDCLMLRYSGAREYVWTLQTPAGPQKFEVHGPYDTDDGDGAAFRKRLRRPTSLREQRGDTSPAHRVLDTLRNWK